MALRGGNALNSGSARKSAKFVKTPVAKGREGWKLSMAQKKKKKIVMAGPKAKKTTVGSKGRKQRRAR